MTSDTLPKIELTAQEVEYLQKMQQLTNSQFPDNSHEVFDVLRWCHAYSGDLETAAKKYKRHLRIRQILQLDHICMPNSGHEIDDHADEFAPMSYLGNTTNDQPCAVFLEQSGLFDFGKIMETVRLSPFMLARFRQMERITNEIKAIERTNRKQSGAILIIDLKGLSFQTNLISFVSGTYRIIWGTLMEQYPFIFKKFLIINAPSFMNMLWSACSTFIPSEYKEKIHLLNTNSDFSSLHEHVDSFLLPNEYGGQSPIQIQKPIECNVSLIDVPNNAQLDWVCIPAGKSVVQTYYLMQGQKLQSYLRNSQEFSLNVFFTADKKSLTNPQKEMEELDEVFAGCERPGLPTLDAWSWTSHKNGFYHVIFGNEKAWLMSVSLEFQLFQLHPNGSKIKINPIPV